MFNFRLVTRAAAGALLLVAVWAGQATAQITDDDLYGKARTPFRLTAGLGVRSDLIRSSGLDAFSTTDGLSQSALSVGYHLSGTELSGILLGFEWNHATTTAAVRGAEASLTIDRLTLALESRVAVGRRVSVFGRVAPGLLRDRARMVDPSAPGGAYGGLTMGDGLAQTKWVPTADVSGGLALRFGELRGRGAPVFGFWLTAEGGYGYAAAHDLVLASRAETQPGRVDEPLRLGQLAWRGAFMRFRIAVSF